MCILAGVILSGSAAATRNRGAADYASNTLYFNKEDIGCGPYEVCQGEEFYLGDAVDNDRYFYEVKAVRVGSGLEVLDTETEDGKCILELRAEEIGTYRVKFSIYEQDSGAFRGSKTATVIVNDRCCEEECEDYCCSY